MNKVHEAEIDRIVARPYSREFVPEEDGTWFARVVEFTGCISVGETQQEAFTMLEDAMRAWIGDALESGEPIPEPFASREYSGKFLVRVPPELHRDLARKAEREGVSLNQHLTTILSTAVGASSMENTVKSVTVDLDRMLTHLGSLTVNQERSLGLVDLSKWGSPTCESFSKEARFLGSRLHEETVSEIVRAVLATVAERANSSEAERSKS